MVKTLIPFWVLRVFVAPFGQVLVARRFLKMFSIIQAIRFILLLSLSIPDYENLSQFIKYLTVSQSGFYIFMLTAIILTLNRNEGFLHICNDFNYQKLYINLFRENAKSIDQVVYCGNRNKEITGNNVDSTVSNIEYFNPYIVYPFDKINYFGKALRQFNFIKKNIKLSEIDHIRTHFFLRWNNRSAN